VDNDSSLRVRGEGESGTSGHGDLFVLIGVKEHPVFERHHNDIVCEVSISMVKATLGGETEVPTLTDGKVVMKIPPGTQSGKLFRLKGRGISDLHGYGKGDEIVRVNVETPTNLSSEEKRILADFARSRGEDISASSSFTDKIKRAFK
jgi:molecular chaperone DnaJ